jgi:hypothetical protein
MTPKVLKAFVSDLNKSGVFDGELLEVREELKWKMLRDVKESFCK